MATQSQGISSNTWCAAALATGIWIVASTAVITDDGNSGRPDAVVWTATSSEKVASHPTLVRRAIPGSSTAMRTASLSHSR